MSRFFCWLNAFPSAVNTQLKSSPSRRAVEKLVPVREIMVEWDDVPAYLKEIRRPRKVKFLAQRRLDNV